ncbi:MAG: Ig-like domain repeat protein, partial [Anaerolineae bacterium]
EHGRTYTIRSRAEDLAGNQQAAYGTGTLTYDSGVPTSSVTTSGLLGKTAWTGTIAGLASDDFAGVDVVHITVRHPDGQYYTGSGWVTSTTWLTTSGTTAWTYPFTPTQGITYTVQSRATDRAGNMQTIFGSAAFSYDGTDPTSTVGVSGFYGPATWTGAITGTAADGESGLQSVVLSIKKSDNTFWNGTTWQAVEVWLPATGTANWSYPFSPQHGEAYTVRAKATDRAGNEQATPSQSTFSYDAAIPVSAITTSGFYRLETWTGQISGTALDEGAGLQRVELTLQRPDNQYYNGSGWQPTEFWLTATGTVAWQYAFTPTDGMTYTVRSRAVDAAGNVQTIYATSSFCYDLQPPDSQVGTGGYYNNLTWTGAITGTATDTTSGVLGVAIILQRSVAPHYWNGTIWQAAQTWVTVTGSVDWSYPFTPDSGIVYTVTSRAVDKAGNTEIAYGTGSFALDVQEPDSVVGTTGFYRAATWTGVITGTASAGISGVARVEITLQRSTDDKYYNGTGWQLTPQWLTATGTLNWSYPFSPTESVTYTVQSRAWSVSGNPEVTYGTGQFIYDSTPPTATLGTSAAYRSIMWTGAITGTAFDAGAGVDFVDFTLLRSADGRYFTG